MNKINVCFMGTPEFSLETLDVLNKDENIDIKLVVTGEDKKRSRNKFLPTVIKKYAIENGLDYLTPKSVNTEEFVEELKNRNIDFIVVVAFGQLIGKKILDAYEDKIINLHPSILPEYRGASPIQSALLNGDEKTAVTTMLIEKGMDSGDILIQEEVEISEEDNFDSLSERLSKIGSQTIKNTLLNFDELYKNRRKQDDDKATFTKKITKEMGNISWEDDKEKTFNKIRALVDFPRAQFVYKENPIKVLEAKKVEINNSKPGFVYKANKNDGLIIGCKNGGIELLKLRPAGKNEMTAKAFILGNSIEENKYL